MISPRQLRKTKKYLARKIEMEMKDKVKEILKPKPKFMPWKIWKFLINLLLDIKK